MSEGKKSIIEKIKNFYEEKYKILLAISFVILITSIGVIGYKIATTGDFMNRGVSLKGGLIISLIPDNIEQKPINVKELENQIKSRFPKNDVSVRALTETGKQIGIIIEIDLSSEEKTKYNELISLIEKSTKTKLTKENSSIEEIGSSLGASFFKEMFIVVILSFILMSLVVFLYFRWSMSKWLFIPSVAVILAAFSDIVTTLAVVNLLGIKISTAGIAAFLMLIGYSVDTDMLLSTRVLVRKGGSVMERIYSSIKTGVMMTSTTICAVTVALIFTQSDTIKQIMIIVLIGMIADLLYTWIQNVGIIRLYIEHLEKKQIKENHNHKE